MTTNENDTLIAEPISSGNMTKTADMLKSFSDFIEKGRKWYSSEVELKGVRIVVSEELDNDDKTPILVASIRWCYSMNTERKKVFEYTLTGFEKLCEWLDYQRIMFANEILA